VLNFHFTKIFEKEHERHEKFKAAKAPSSGARHLTNHFQIMLDRGKLLSNLMEKANCLVKCRVSSAGDKPTPKFEVDFARTFQISTLQKVGKSVRYIGGREDSRFPNLLLGGRF